MVPPVKRPLFSVPLRDLDSGDKRRSWKIPPEWIAWAVEESEAEARGEEGQLELYLKKNGGEVLVKGTASAAVRMRCARTLDPVDVEIRAEILLMLSPKPGQEAQQEGKGPRKKRAPRRSSENEEEVLTGTLAAQDHFEGETLELDEFVREHLLLELPAFPLRSDLPLEPPSATDTPPVDSGEPERRGIDPRLAPLAALASQMQRRTKE